MSGKIFIIRRRNMAEFRPRKVSELMELKRLTGRGDGGMNPDDRLNPEKDAQLRQVRNMGFDRELLAQVSPKVLDLTVSDLNDLAKKFVGIDVKNDAVNSMTIEDLQGMEALFADAKTRILQNVAGSIGDMGNVTNLVSVDVSCCCCTPCCCCAASDTSPFEV
jgi:hypothetical protein